MPIRKRNEYLDAGGSDDDESQASAPEAGADSRTAGLTSRSSKRRKITITGPESDDESGSDGSGVALDDAADKRVQEDSEDPVAPPKKESETSTTHLSPSTWKRHLVAHTSKPGHKPGVIYLSRIPPFMRPSTVKTYLSTYGPISKIFLTPEPPSTYLRRKKGGGNKKHSFIDGWVEFAKKKHAKQCVESINGQIVGGRKGGWYRDDVWNAKYLRGFGWGDLMQSVRAEEREREERVRVGTKRERRERGEFLRNLERSKVEAARREKRKKKLGEGPKEDGEDNAMDPADEGALEHQKEQHEVNGGKRKHFERRFRQNEVKAMDTTDSKETDDVRRILGKIF